MSWLFHIWLLFNCHIALDQSMQVHLPSAVLCPSLLPYCLLMTTAFPPWSAACKVLSFMILVMTNWKPSSWLCLVYKWRFSVFGLITQMILTLSLPLYTMMNKNNWPAASLGVTSEWGVLTGDQFCTFQLIVDEVCCCGAGRWSQVCALPLSCLTGAETGLSLWWSLNLSAHVYLLSVLEFFLMSVDT